uniref:SURP motif domain-containing protein n=1 Tax=Clastoptera arizonana TaxID=38151 RepID=A0A1B6CH97_9HEMI
MSQEKKNWNNSDTGILRKKDESDTELLIFGYSCKLFRDDAKALDIDQGKHLIPWMGDETLKIDRYDVRGALYDISKYEANILDSSISWDALSSEERKVELMCNEERYRALYHNEEEEALYQEEELKRLHQILDDKEYGQVAYQYQEKPIASSSNLRKTGDNNSDNGGIDDSDDDNSDDNSDEIFIPLVQLDIPQNMIIPKTKKQNAIIEKTALFIHKQGPQMEILLKMKQASNPQFQFLSISCPLHSYYRHVLAVIKTGRYIPTFTDEGSDGGNKYEDHYLHPSLLPTQSTIEVGHPCLIWMDLWKCEFEHHYVENNRPQLY